MDPILENLVQQTGVDVRPLLPGREDEYLLTYDDKLQVCFSLRNNKGKEYYDSCAWSCGASCYITCYQEHVYLYSPLLEDADCYELDFVKSRWPKMFEYLSKFFMNKVQNVYEYFYNFYSSLDEDLLTPENGQYLKLVECLWDGDGHEIDEDFAAKLENIKAGFSVKGQRIVPDFDIIKRYVLHSIIDLFLVLFETGDHDTLRKWASRTNKGVEIGLIPSSVVRLLLKDNLRFRNLLPSISICLPVSLGISYCCEVIKEVRRSNYRGHIDVILQTIVRMPDCLTNVLNGLLADDNVHITIQYENLFVDDWHANSNLLVVLPPYKIISQLISRWKNDLGEERIPDGLKNEQTIPFTVLRKALNAINEEGTILAILPEFSLQSSECISKRESIKDEISIELIRRIGSYLYPMGMGVSCLFKAKREGANPLPQQIRIHWCDDTYRDGFFDAARAQNQKLAHAVEYIEDITEYGIATPNLRLDNWAPRPFSENSLIDSIFGRIDTNHLLTLGRIFNVYVGARTSMNKVFIIDRETYLSLGETEKSYFCPSATSGNIRDGKLLNEKYIFYPYQGDLKPLAEGNFSKRLPIFNRILLPYKDILKTRKSTVSNWWDLSYHSCPNAIGTPKIIIPYLIKKGSFAYDSAGTYITSNGFQLVPKKKITSIDDVLYAYIAIMNSNLFWRLVGIYCEPSSMFSKSDSYRGKKQSLESIPLPDLSKFRNERYVMDLVEIGRFIQEGGVSSINQEELNQLVERLYHE